MGAWSTRLIVGGVGLVWGLAAEALYHRAGVPAYEVLLDLAIGWTYLYGGLAIWASRPANPSGRMMTLVGLTWFIGNVGVSDISGLHEIASVLGDIAAVALIALILVYPSGRLETRLDRATIVILAVGSIVNNAIQFLPVPSDFDVGLGRLVGGVALTGVAGVVVIRRWVVAPRRRRPELLPVLIAGSILLGVLVTNLVIQIIPAPEAIESFLVAGKTLAPAAIPLALLVGFYRQSELRQRALVDAMPDLMIRLTRDGRYLDIQTGNSALLGGAVPPAGVDRIEDVLPADAAEAIRSAASMAMGTGSLQTSDVVVELPGGRREFEIRVTPSGADEATAIIRDFTDQRAAQAELRRSRARMVEATDAERRRLERDLHDGAQQRLVSASLALRLARSRLGRGTDRGAMASLNEAADQLKTAVVELRELARGIHPAVLTQAGLGAAIDSLADRSTVPTDVTVLPDRRLPRAVEASAYFVVSEALANVAKYASATRATISAECAGTSLRVEVADDGVGGADAGGGSGLRGLADRVTALGGSLSVVSPAGGGTRVVADIPLDQQSA
jgi:signal transduction histidine kinase